MQIFKEEMCVRKALEKRSATEVRDAIERARAYAAEKGVPLTAERIAAELGVAVTVLRRYLREDYVPPKRCEAVVQALRDAAGEATASVLEYAMTRGSSPNMHMLYLKQYAGYSDKPPEEGNVSDPVIFSGEGELT